MLEGPFWKNSISEPESCSEVPIDKEQLFQNWWKRQVQLSVWEAEVELSFAEEASR